MKIFKILFLFNLILNYTTCCYSQETKMDIEVEEIVLLGKDAIIQLALKKIKEAGLSTDEGISIANFTQIKVLTDGKEVWVSFSNPIKYLPKKTVFYFDIGVGLLEGTVSTNRVSNPEDYDEKKIPFYKETKETKMNIQFVLEAINESGEVGEIDIANFEDNMIIREYENYYDLSIVSESQESYYKIEKTSGKIYDSEHAHLVPPPNTGDEDKFKEINWD
ncbi:hypothetical protein MTsPCn5_30620 [Croceitalea sp. MTPC5]|nr:hypothetical protein MTsPCn5_30620 [Croceitalea sp. MTPC5]